MGLKQWPQMPPRRGGDGDDAVKSRDLLVEPKRPTLRVRNGSTAFLNQQDAGGQVPFILRFDGDGGMDLSRGNEGQGVRDGEHGTALDQAAEPCPSATPEFPGADHDERGGILRWPQRHRLAIQGEAL